MRKFFQWFWGYGIPLLFSTWLCWKLVVSIRVENWSAGSLYLFAILLLVLNGATSWTLDWYRQAVKDYRDIIKMQEQNTEDWRRLAYSYRNLLLTILPKEEVDAVKIPRGMVQ